MLPAGRDGAGRTGRSLGSAYMPPDFPSGYAAVDRSRSVSLGYLWRPAGSVLYELFATMSTGSEDYACEVVLLAGWAYTGVCTAVYALHRIL